MVPPDSMPGVRSRRVSIAELAARLRIGYDRAAELVHEGRFTDLREKKKRQGAPAFVPEDEVEVAEMQGLDALDAYRERKFGKRFRK